MRQLISYGVIGIVSNTLGYALYLFLTWVWLEPKVAMTLLYGAGATLSFLANRRLTFMANDGVLGSGARFLLAHLLGYALNLILLITLVDKMGYPHQWVQLAAILFVAVFLFFMMKRFVFRQVGVP